MEISAGRFQYRQRDSPRFIGSAEHEPVMKLLLTIRSALLSTLI